MLEISRILDQLSRAFNGESWSGPSLFAALNGLTAADAAAHPLAGGHSIWEIILHLTYNTELTVWRLKENKVFPYNERNGWPAQPFLPTQEEWQAALGALYDAHI